MRLTQLFCLPYAGGGASVFNHWKSLLPPQVEMIPIELPGRGTRYTEPFYESFQEAVADIKRIMWAKYSGGNYAVFGHSMGCWLAYELYKDISRKGEALPTCMFLSGRAAPCEQNIRTRLHLQSDARIIAELKRLGGTSKEIFEDKDMLSIVIRVMRADLKLLENYKFNDDGTQIESSVMILGGTRDNTMSKRQIERWRRHASSPIHVHWVDGGGHFFIHTHAQEVTRAICDLILINQVMHV